MPLSRLVSPGEKIKLSEIEPGDAGGLDKEQGTALRAKLGQEFMELQQLLSAAGDVSLLVVFQGRDTSGKDGAIRRVLDYANIQSCRAVSFKVPTEKELSHDFLWRVHAETPPRGGITIFNRSHYEDVLVVRVHDLAPKAVWSKRYGHINAFEQLLADSGAIVLKFFLHISPEEQERRLLDREADITKSWKLNVSDWKDRERWDDYTEAYEDVLEKCSIEAAPWRIIPANKKWFRDCAVLEALTDTLRPHREKWLEILAERSEQAGKEIRAYRESLKQPL